MSATTTSGPRGLSGRALAAATLALLLGVFAVGSQALVISPLLEDVADDFGTGVGSAGLSVSVYGLAVAIVAPAAGWVNDRTSRRAAGPSRQASSPRWRRSPPTPCPPGAAPSWRS